MALLELYICMLCLCKAAFTLPVANSLPPHCTDLKPLYLLNHAIPNRYSLPRGVSIVYDEAHSLHAYQLSEHAGNLNFEASDLFTQCSYWPDEYSVLATFKLSPNSAIPEWENGYLFSLVPADTVELKLGMSLSRTKLTVFYSDFKIQPGRKSISFDTELYDDKWHTIIVTVAGNSIGLRVDCGKTETKLFKRTFPAFLDTSGDNIHVGNRKIHPGQFRGMLKQLLVLPGADASQLACPTTMPGLPSISRQPDVQMMEADDPHKITYQIPYDAECTWQETGKMWYDIYNQQLKVCLSGAWQLAHMAQQAASANMVQTLPQLDYFEESQRLTTIAPSVEIHKFTIPGEGQFVMMANYFQNTKDDRSTKRRQKSMLYRWEDEILKPYQNISCYGPSSFATFQAGRHFYLAIANLYASSDRAKSEYVVVYKWHMRRKIFRSHQELPASAPRDVEHFEINGDHYLAVANHASKVPLGKRNYTSDYNSRSFIWKFDMETSNFSKFQKISTVGAWDWTYFSIANETGPGRFHFLALANTINNNREVVQASQIFYYVENQGPVGSGNFFKVQDIMTSGATDFEYFEISGESYLAVANSVGPVRNGNFVFETTSVIYKANKARKQFEVFQEIPTFGILDWEYFTVGNDSFLIGSNQQPTSSSQSKDTIIYRWKGAEKFVESAKIQTDASADWEVIYEGMNTYLIYANGGGSKTEIFKAKLR